MVDVRREEVDVDGTRMSYLAAGEHGPVVLLLHGTFWSRVWQPVMARLGQVCRPVAMDLPGFGYSDGELSSPEGATVPALAEIVHSFAERLGVRQYAVVGHDIGGAIAQHLAAYREEVVTRLALVNGVVLDSWPVPAVERFQDPQVRAETTVEDLLRTRRTAMGRTTVRELSEAELDEYLDPWRDERRVRSWMSMAAAADSRYTTEVVDKLRARALPMLLVWGTDDEFQRLEYAERFVRQFPQAELVRVTGKHIPTEDSPQEIGDALAGFLTG
ncbi:alpha/beta hydrolase [Actinopolyspora sp. BKK1]|uniref:alpha/beta fold hydrolase n=1 Tax=unclassified Actinopolyspora TaxID=2639451 RepID=UPI00325AF38A